MTTTKNDMKSTTVSFQVVENPNGQIQMWPKGHAKTVLDPINVSRATGRTGSKVWKQLRALLDEGNTSA